MARLNAAGLSPHEAAHWLNLADTTEAICREVVDSARRYQAAGIPAERAREWFGLAVGPTEAEADEVNGWYPGHIWRFRRDYHVAAHPDPQDRFRPWERRPDEREWIATQIGPGDVDLYISAGHTPAGAREAHAQRLAGDTSVEPGLIMLATLRNGAS